MKVVIQNHDSEDMNVIIFCKNRTKNVDKLKLYIEAYEDTIYAKRDDERNKVRISSILYFESVDNKTFLYTNKQYYEIEQKLYELEEILSQDRFIRCSKSIIINITKIKTLKSELNRSLLATLENGEQIHISRRYAKSLKELLEVENTKI